MVCVKTEYRYGIPSFRFDKREHGRKWWFDSRRPKSKALLWRLWRDDRKQKRVALHPSCIFVRMDRTPTRKLVWSVSWFFVCWTLDVSVKVDWTSNLVINSFLSEVTKKTLRVMKSSLKTLFHHNCSSPVQYPSWRVEEVGWFSCKVEWWSGGVSEERSEEWSAFSWLEGCTVMGNGVMMSSVWSPTESAGPIADWWYWSWYWWSFHQMKKSKSGDLLLMISKSIFGYLESVPYRSRRFLGENKTNSSHRNSGSPSSTLADMDWYLRMYYSHVSRESIIATKCLFFRTQLTS